MQRVTLGLSVHRPEMMPLINDQMAKKLVWLPTRYQAQLICQHLAGSKGIINSGRSDGQTVSSIEELLDLYGLIIDVLKEKAHPKPA